MIAADLIVIDRPTITAPLGVQFWDRVQDIPIGEGLDVVAFPTGHPEYQTAGVANTVGVYVFHHLPGLRAFETGGGNVTPRAFVIQVRDPSGSFLPCTFGVTAPQVGLAPFACGSPIQSPAVPLYSAPTRKTPAGMAVVRADLLDTSLPPKGRPAAWAVLEARIDGALAARGVADDQGRVVLFFAYPEPTGFAAGSPLGPGGRALTDQMWTLNVSAAYAPAGALTPTLSQGARELPDQCATLNQPPAILWSDAAQTLHLTQLTLRFGQELIARSDALPNLLITPTGSPV